MKQAVILIVVLALAVGGCSGMSSTQQRMLSGGAMGASSGVVNDLNSMFTFNPTHKLGLMVGTSYNDNAFGSLQQSQNGGLLGALAGAADAITSPLRTISSLSYGSCDSARAKISSARFADASASRAPASWPFTVNVSMGLLVTKVQPRFSPSIQLW